MEQVQIRRAYIDGLSIYDGLHSCILLMYYNLAVTDF